MFFESLKIHGFGCLRTEAAFVPDKLNLVIADNETGKSTLVSALLAAFYGIEEDRRKIGSERPHLTSVLPWIDPNQFGVTLDFTLDDARWRIERDFHNKSVRLIDRETGQDHADDYHKGKGNYRIGEELIGMEVEDFLKCFYLEQQAFNQIRNTGRLTEHVQQAATAQEGGVTSEKAIEALRQALRKYPHPSSNQGLMIENALKRYRSRLDEIAAQMDSLTLQREEIEPKCARLGSIERDIERLTEERRHNNQLGNRAELIELKQIFDKQDQLKTKLTELNATSDKLKDFADFPADKWEELINLTGRLDKTSTEIEKLRSDVKTKADALTEIDSELNNYPNLREITEEDVAEFDTAVSLLEDRRNRFEGMKLERDQVENDLVKDGFNQDGYNRFKQVFGQLGDDDIEFIDDFPTASAQKEADFREKRARREGLQHSYEQLERSRRKKIAVSMVFFAIFALMIIAGGFMIVLSMQPGLGKIVAGAGVLLGMVGAIMRGSSRSSGLRESENEYNTARDAEAQAHKKIEILNKKLDEIAIRSDMTDGDKLLEGYQDLEKMKKLAGSLLEADHNLERVQADDRDALKRVGRFFDKAGETLTEDERVMDAARELLGKYRAVAELKARYQTISETKKQSEDDLKRSENELKEQRKQITKILNLGGVEKTEPLERAAKEFQRGIDKQRKYKQIVDEQIPTIERELLSETELKAKQDRLEYLREKETPDDDSTTPEHKKEYYRERADECSSKMDKLSEERLDIKHRIAVVYEKYQSQYPELHREFSELKEGLDRAETFQTEVQTSIEIMEEIASEVYRIWAAALSEETAPLLNALNPKYKEMKFGSDLSFSITDGQTERIISSNEIEQTLSTGARDEIYLGARLGIAGYLARGAKGPLPVVLDEPLATADDEKFLSGMKFFMNDLSRRHQVLILSCHTQRHRWLERNLADLFRERVHVIELAS